jgi:hypothetical protein
LAKGKIKMVKMAKNNNPMMKNNLAMKNEMKNNLTKKNKTMMKNEIKNNLTKKNKTMKNKMMMIHSPKS